MSSFICDSGPRQPRLIQTNITCASVMLPSFLLRQFCILNSHIYNKRKLLFSVCVSENICVTPNTSELT